MATPTNSNDTVPKPGRRAQKVQARKDHILNIAARLFRERGYHAVSIDEIGSASGMTGPAMYKYFKDKASILVAILEYGSLKTEESLDAIDPTGLSVEEILLERVRCHIEFTGQVRDAMVVAVREVNNIPEWFQSGFLALQRRIREQEVDLLMKMRPELSIADARYICTNVFQGLISSSVYLYPADSDARKKRLAAMAMAALRA